MSRRNIREQQIQEYLNQDTKRSSLVADMIKKGVSRFEPVLDPVKREQLNMLDISNVGNFINQFKIKLTDKINTFSTVVNSTDLNKPVIASNIDNLCNFLSDMLDYNKIIQVYLNPSNTPQTRSQIFNNIITLKPMFDNMKKGFRKLIDKLHIEDEPDLYKKFFVKSLRAHALYEVLEEQFKKNIFYIISERDVENALMALVSRNTDIRNIIRDNRLDLTPPPSAPPPPPPPPATPGGYPFMTPPSRPFGLPPALPASPAPPATPGGYAFMTPSSRPFGLPSPSASASPAAPTPTAAPAPAAAPTPTAAPAPAVPATPSSSSSSSMPSLETDPAALTTPASTPRVPRPSPRPTSIMLPTDAYRSEVPDAPASSRFGTLGGIPSPQIPADARPRSLLQLEQFAKDENISMAQLTTVLNQVKEATSNELDILSARLNRLRDTGSDESLIRSVETTMRAKVAHYNKVEEELKLLRSSAFSMASPPETGRSRAPSFASATSAQTAMSENEDEGLQRRAREAMQSVQRIEPEVVQRVEQAGLKKLVKLFLQSLRGLAPNAIGTVAELTPQYVEWVQNNPNTAAAAAVLSAVHAISIQEGFELSGYQVLLDYVKALGVAPLAAEAISLIMQGVARRVSALFDEYRRQGEEAIRRARVAALREIIERTTLSRALGDLGPQSLDYPYIPRDPYVPPPPKAVAKRLALGDIQREPTVLPSPQRRAREEEMPEAKAPKAKQRVVSEQEIMAEAKQKATPANLRPSAQPYIPPPPKVSEQDIMATAKSKAIPKAQDIIATQTPKTIPKVSEPEILATQTSKAKPKGAPRLEDRQPLVITPEFAASTALLAINSIEALAKNEEEVAKLNKELSNPSITKNEKSSIQFRIRSENKKANILMDEIKTGASTIRKNETVKIIYDRAVEILEGLKNDKTELRMIQEGRIEKSKTHLSQVQHIAQKSNDIKEKETALASIKRDLMEINRGVQSSSAAASSSGAGKFKLKPRAKAKTRLKPIKEDEEIIELIKPAKNHLSYIDLNNDPYLINKIR